MGKREVVEENYTYMTNCTNYLSSGQMTGIARRYFSAAYFDQYAYVDAVIKDAPKTEPHSFRNFLVKSARCVLAFPAGDAVWRFLSRRFPPTRWILENFMPIACLILRK